MPLWNPLQQLGGPFLATLQTGVLYPPNALHLLLDTQPAFAASALLHVALAAWLAALLARACGAEAVGAATAGLLYAGSVQIWSAVWTPPTLYTAAWTPGVLFAVLRIVERPSPRRSAVLAGALAMQLLAGWPYFVAMSALAAAGLGGAELARRSWRERRLPLREGLALAAGVGVGVLLAAPQLLPSLELMARSTRVLGTLVGETAGLGGEMHDPRWFAMRLLRLGISDGVPGLASVPLAIAGAVLAGPGRARAALLLAGGALALAASFPDPLPVYDALSQLPVLGDFRFPFRYRLLTTLALAVCAGVGVSRLAARGGRAGLAVALALAAIGVAIEAVPMARLHAGGLVTFPRNQPYPVRDLEDQLAVVRRPEHASTRSFWRAFGLDKLGQREGIRVLQDLEPLSLGTTARLMTYFATGDAGARSEGETALRAVLGAPYSGSVMLTAETAERAPLLDLAAVRFIAASEPPAWLDRRASRIAGTRDPLLYENPTALPRAWRALRGEREPVDAQAALARLVAPGFDLRQDVLLEPLPGEVEAFAASPAAADPDAETEIEVDEPHRVVVRTRGSRGAVLVLGDAFYPGWRATLDGAPVPTLRADTALRAVVVPAGEHRVEWRYEPRAWRVGIALAGLGAALLLAAALRREPG